MSILGDTTLSTLWTYWRQKRAGRDVPLFESIDLHALGPTARRVVMVERDLAGRFRYRHIGAAVQETYGSNMEGSYIETALPPGRGPQAAARYALACDARRPVLTRSRYGASPTVTFIVDRLILPLARADGSICGAMNGQVMRSPRDVEDFGSAQIAQMFGDEVIYPDPEQEGAVSKMVDASPPRD